MGPVGDRRMDLPCSRGLAMVARTAPWLSHACFASGHFTISALSWPLKLKHCTGGGTGWSRVPPQALHCPHSPTLCSPFLPQWSLSPLHPSPHHPTLSCTLTPRHRTSVHAAPSVSPKTCACIPPHPTISKPPHPGRAVGGPGGGRPLSVPSVPC